MIAIRENPDIKKYGKEIISIRGIRFFDGYFKRKRCYGVQQLSTGYCAVFNRRKRVLDVLVNMVKNGANICRSGTENNMLLFVDGKSYTTLANFLYYAYYSVKSGETKSGNNIMHKERIDKMIEDCREENLYMGGSSVHYDETNDIITVESNTGKFIDIFSNVPIIADIINECRSVRQNTYGRVMGNYKDINFAVPDLAYLAYYDNDLTVNNFREKIAELKRYKEVNGLSIEHLDGDFHNHRKYNIVLVEESLNSRKNDKISRIVEPFCFTVVFDKPFNSGVESGGQFKMLIGEFYDDLMLRVDKRFITDCFENVVNMIDIYIAEYPKRIDKESALLNNERLIFNERFAELLAKEPAEHFTCLDNL